MVLTEIIFGFTTGLVMVGVFIFLRKNIWHSIYLVVLILTLTPFVDVSEYSFWFGFNVSIVEGEN